MSRRILVAVLMASGALALAIPVLARTPTTHRHSSLSLVMGGRVGLAANRGHLGVAAVDNPGPATVSFQGFRCQVTIGQGASDTNYVNHVVFDSTQFYIPHNAQSNANLSVTTNCVGTLPPGTPVAPTIVSAPTAHCGQFNPFNRHKFIFGRGITTTFPDGMFSETCNTPKFHH
jgi:hypothetical protein